MDENGGGVGFQKFLGQRGQFVEDSDGSFVAFVGDGGRGGRGGRGGGGEHVYLYVGVGEEVFVESFEAAMGMHVEAEGWDRGVVVRITDLRTYVQVI